MPIPTNTVPSTSMEVMHTSVFFKEASVTHARESKKSPAKTDIYKSKHNHKEC